MDRDSGEPAVVGHRHRRCRRDRPQRRRAARCRQHRRNPGADPAVGARGRPRHAFGDQIPERPQRRDRRDVDDGARGRVLGAVVHGTQQRRRNSRQLRSLSSAARHANLVPASSSAPAARPSKSPRRCRKIRGCWTCCTRGCRNTPVTPVAARQMTGGFGGMLSMRVRGGAEAAIATAARVEIWKRATSLGGVESLIEHRASVEGADSPAPARPAAPLGRDRGPRRFDRRPRIGARRVRRPTPDQTRFERAIRHISAVYSCGKPANRCGFVACAVGPRNINECLQLAPILNRSARRFAEKAELGG